MCLRARVCVGVTKSIETCKGSRVVRVMWSRCLSHLSLRLFLGLWLFLQRVCHAFFYCASLNVACVDQSLAFLLIFTV